MNKLANVLIAFVAIQHIGFLVLEMFLWNSPTGMKIFGTTPEFAGQSTVLAANQGLYNGFLAAGLIWGMMYTEGGFAIKVFFLSCVVIAGIFGAVTAKPSILFVQAAPAFVALLLLWFSQRGSG